MRKTKITALFLLCSMLLSSMTTVAVSADEIISNINEEQFIEYDAETGKETVFTLDDVTGNSTANSNTSTVYTDGGTSYTLPYDPETGYGNIPDVLK